ncbi:MAG: hypothetical protein K9G76_12680 [Bacteroidales bacterium]|nr:hypothetical protein [Bacteroidales bacterium]MCF8405391.1 hypothetical protein [Bacteroidales bacterium]
MKYYLLLLFSLWVISTFGQNSVSDTSLSIPMFYASYAVQLPGGDMADRYGVNSTVGGGFMWKIPTHWILGADFSYIFGNKINNSDELLSNLKTENGNIIDMGGNFADYSLYERGFYVSGRFGKMFPVLSPNPNSGIVLMGSAGYLQHKIRIEVLNNTAPQLQGDYKRGYDRLTGGFGISEFVGYMYLSDSRLLNFFGGFEFNQAWTSPMREVNFDTRLPDEKQNRFDSFVGFRLGWIVPIFQRLPDKEYYF